jgi:hypothetical protein
MEPSDLTPTLFYSSVRPTEPQSGSENPESGEAEVDFRRKFPHLEEEMKRYIHSLLTGTAYSPPVFVPESSEGSDTAQDSEMNDSESPTESESSEENPEPELDIISDTLEPDSGSDQTEPEADREAGSDMPGTDEENNLDEEQSAEPGSGAEDEADPALEEVSEELDSEAVSEAEAEERFFKRFAANGSRRTITKSNFRVTSEDSGISKTDFCTTYSDFFSQAKAQSRQLLSNY